MNFKNFWANGEHPCKQGEWGSSWGTRWDENFYHPPPMGNQST